MHVAKSGLRALGIAESYSGREQSTLAGVVMRKDLQIDGVAFARVTVGGSDATDAVIRIFTRLARRDINLVMISGSVIAWYNIIDPSAVQDAIGLPVIVTTYEESDGLEEDIRSHFPGDAGRLAAYRRLGDRIPVRLHSGYTLFIRPYGLSLDDAARLCNDFTREGRVPEPVRVARLIARGLVRSSLSAPDDQNR
ncbi:DUF99 family protein [Methanoculleus sp. YWC-01]|jgi:endonuclease V-like protein UPF0215 family|uniref:UPF0215 protein HL657_08610 n=1 Tax=Methanoculleus nereidis TaxID=2735141 RepID=A0ABU3Z3Q0_9EURY|nr:DUF99 family protein [Methanoculleus sp. YWC-01]MDV4343225.1 DUF99 family protein [Methanoculleus sp. YWC-01]